MLVDYPNSDSEDDQPHPTAPQSGIKRKAESTDADPSRPKGPPPLPSTFHALYATNVRAFPVDDPALHGGRTRHTPHVAGHWPTHVYLEWFPSNEESQLLEEAIHAARLPRNPGDVHSFLSSDLGTPLPLHISLSAPIVLRTEQKDHFQQGLTNAVAGANIRPFEVQAQGLAWVPNHDGTRYFLVLKLTRPSGDELNELLHVCNQTAKRLGLPLLYEEVVSTLEQTLLNNTQMTDSSDKSGAFHISIAWTLEKPTVQSEALLKELDASYFCTIIANFDRLMLKIGNAVVTLPLSIDRGRR